LLLSCGQSEKRQFDKPQIPVQQTLGPTNPLSGPSGTTTTPIKPEEMFSLPPGPVFQAQYNITVKGPLDITVCEGKADLKITDKFTFEVPQAWIGCFFNMCQFDLKSALGTAASDPSANILKDAAVESGILKLPSLGGATFTPARPVFLSPFVFKPEEYMQINLQQFTQVRGPDGAVDSGTMGLKVLGVNETMTAKNGVTYNKIMRWQMTADGFKSMKPKFFLMDKFELAWNLDPIAVPQVKVKGMLKDFMRMGPSGAGGSCPIQDIAQQNSGGLMGFISKLMVELSEINVTLDMINQTDLSVGP
jgi:hypothetical protein